MTDKARMVLEDCKGALSDFKDGLQGAEWRRHWMLCVILLRVVGHVLDKVDGKANPQLGKIVDGEYERLKKSKPNPSIFWEFIDQERNNLIKLYETSAGQGVTTKMGAVGTSELPETEYHYFINSGPFQGRDQRDMIREAISWWENHLNNIDKKLKQGGTQQMY